MKIYPVYVSFSYQAEPFLYVLANNEKQVLKKIDEKFVGNSWSGNYNDYTHHEQEGHEDYYSYMLDIRGEVFDEVAMNEALKGSQQYGWGEGQNITLEEAQVMLKFGIVEDWCDVEV